MLITFKTFDEKLNRFLEVYSKEVKACDVEDVIKQWEKLNPWNNIVSYEEVT